MVRRHEFDECLREICAKRGVKFLHGSVKNVNYIIDEEDKFNSTVKSLNVKGLDEKDYSVLSGFIIDASGQQAIISRKMGTREAIGDMGLQARYTYFEGVDFENAKKHGLFEQRALTRQADHNWTKFQRFFLEAYINYTYPYKKHEVYVLDHLIVGSNPVLNYFLSLRFMIYLRLKLLLLNISQIKVSKSQ